MLNQAIIFTQNNASLIADSLIDYTTAQDLLDAYDSMFANNTKLVLARDVLSDGQSVVSYVVTESMFRANNPDIQLSHLHFTTVYKI